MGEPFRVALVGTGFMGRAHSNAWLSVDKFFDLPRRVSMEVVCARDLETAREFADRWGWRRATARLAEAFEDVDLVDVGTPNNLHAGQSIAALEAGCHVACEKPLAGTITDARAMRDAARRAGTRSFVWFNYRRCPAVALARRLCAAGDLGSIRHVRACYLQEWGGPDTPMSWRFDSSLAGSGAHGDLNGHIVDMARFVTGDEITEIAGALDGRFIETRPGPGGGAAGRSTVDDCLQFLARFESGAVGLFEATRVATGNSNRNSLEINGSRGAIRFDFERMNELQWFDAAAPADRRGWTTIDCTTAPEHPYIEAYWPPGHPIGYEHQFISQAADMIRVLTGGAAITALPDFEDAYRTQCVLEAALVSARERRPVEVDEVDD